MPEPAAKSKVSEGFVAESANRLPDRGPRYQETPADPYGPTAPFLAEPYNAATASFFILIAAYWLWRLRGRYRQFPFTTACTPILLAGGIGGTLYHAFRTRTAYFLLDLIPILVLGVVAAIYLCVRLGRWHGWGRVAFGLVGLVAFVVGSNLLLLNVVPEGNRNLRVNLSYLSQAILIVGPLLFVLVKTRFRDAGLIAAALASFAIAWFCRLVDGLGLVDLPMGTHWLWHTFGALTTLFMFAYFARLEAAK